ncbi:uncharacterized protein LOC135393206 isoform X2 [Ornithodoros turicata]|uniref:uncharacterized protein LOC135393206 isoform X2 n=1 Tax=Ornithodoros turicata TaxID=34597 RepID=UPI0031395C09
MGGVDPVFSTRLYRNTEPGVTVSAVYICKENNPELQVYMQRAFDFNWFFYVGLRRDTRTWWYASYGDPHPSAAMRGPNVNLRVGDLLLVQFRFLGNGECEVSINMKLVGRYTIGGTLTWYRTVVATGVALTEFHVTQSTDTYPSRVFVNGEHEESHPMAPGQVIAGSLIVASGRAKDPATDLGVTFVYEDEGSRSISLGAAPPLNQEAVIGLMFTPTQVITSADVGGTTETPYNITTGRIKSLYFSNLEVLDLGFVWT